MGIQKLRLHIKNALEIVTASIDSPLGGNLWPSASECLKCQNKSVEGSLSKLEGEKNLTQFSTRAYFYIYSKLFSSSEYT